MRFQNDGTDKFYIGSRGTVSGSGGTGYDIYAVGGNDIRFFPGTLLALTLDTSANATFAGTLTVEGADAITIPDYILHAGDDSKFGFPSNDNFKVRLAGTDKFTMSATINRFSNIQNAGSRLELYNNRQDAGNVEVYRIAAYNSAEVAGIHFYRGGGSQSGYTKIFAKKNNASNLEEVVQFGTNDALTTTFTSNVGIGTTLNLGRELLVKGEIAALDNTGTNDNQILMAISNTIGNLAVTYGSTGSYVPFQLETSGTPRFTVSTAGAIKFNAYDSTNQTGTPTYLLGTDASGNIVKTNTVPGSGAGPYLPLAGGTLTGALAGTSASFTGALSSVGYSGTSGTFSASVTASGNSNSFGNTTTAALSATSGSFSASVTAAGNSNSFGTTSFTTGLASTYGNFSGAVNALYFRTAAANSEYSLLTRNSTGNALFVQNAQSGTNQNIAIFQYGNASVNQGTTVLQVAKDKSYFANCNVGIGNTGPTSQLQVGPGTSNASRSLIASLGGTENGVLSALSLVNTSGNDVIGYGVGIDFHLASTYSPTGRIATIAEDTSVKAGMAFYTYESGNFDERIRISSAGAIKFNAYDSTNNTGTPTYLLGTDASGNVVKTNSAPSPITSQAASLYDLIPNGAFTTTYAFTSTAGTYAKVMQGDDVITANGTYTVQMFVNDHAVGGTQYSETYSGIMSWGSSTNTNDTGGGTISEIVLHRSGHAANQGMTYLRTRETTSSEGSELRLEIMCNRTYTGASNVVFKFVRLI
jgi:hypothetical protein